MVPHRAQPKSAKLKMMQRSLLIRVKVFLIKYDSSRIHRHHTLQLREAN